MQRVTRSPIPAATMVWQPAPSRTALTVVAKATFTLAPGISPLAGVEEPLHEHEKHWDDDPNKSLYAPSDMVPLKQKAEIVLVGDACAPDGVPARSLLVRLAFGKVDKSIEVTAPRVLTREGEIREGKRWLKIPVVYERAAGGPKTDNPVGLGPGGPKDMYGQTPLSNLGPKGAKADKAMVAVGYGPIAADWPARRRRAGKVIEGKDLLVTPFGDGFDPAYFQAAPLDQQLPSITMREALTIENLTPDHPKLTTTLPDVSPHALITVEGGEPRELSLSPDTLWIDTRRLIMTLTFRAQMDLRARDVPYRVVVALSHNGAPIPWATVAPPTPPPPPLPTLADPETIEPDIDEIEITQTKAPIVDDEESDVLRGTRKIPAGRPQLPSLPFVPPAPGAVSPASIPLLTPTLDTPSDGNAIDVGRSITTQKLDMSEMWDVAPAPVPAPALVPPPLVTEPKVDVPKEPLGLFSVSNAAAGLPQESSAAQEPTRERVPAEAPSPRGRAQVELVYWDPLQIKAIAASSILPNAPSFEGSDDEKARALAHAIVRRGALGSARDVERSLSEQGDGPAFTLLVGEIELCYDEVALLKATIGAARPLSATDKKLKDTIDLATSMLEAPLFAMPDVAESLTARVREAWSKANRLLPPGTVVACAERVVVEERRYQKREILDATFVRALFWEGPEGRHEGPLPLYIPAKAEKRLPLFKRFSARVVAEVVPQQDAYEIEGPALVATVIGRVMGAKKKR